MLPHQAASAPTSLQYGPQMPVMPLTVVPSTTTVVVTGSQSDHGIDSFSSAIIMKSLLRAANMPDIYTY